uniref:histidine-tRNA synthetase n=1 Tax=Porphyridium aerugineum TaxID=2792 RepID=UPI001FCDB996|nr:histidine-tRNA synthetase [Porphyridium aerugineum]UNJ17970.1 histidine-tRNA synthetase [Porphyridium aerugineum]
MQEIIKKPRGTKDILPKESFMWQNLENLAQSVLSSFGYGKISTPIFEDTILFQRGIGQATDIVNKEMYTFRDQGNRSLTLRPEGTAGAIRALIENRLYNNTINRLWYIGPMFRYERPQNGRQRQFNQLGIECIGSNDPLADFEVIYVAIQILTVLKVKDLKLEINSIGGFNEREEYLLALKTFLNQYKDKLDEDSLFKLALNPLRIFDSKNSTVQEILKDAPLLSKFLNDDSKKHFHILCSYLEASGIEYSINPRLVRGLDYYTYTAFEIKSNSLGAQDTVCGGGRYNNLVEQLSGPNLPAVGWGMGIERLLLIINQSNDQSNILDFYIAPLDEEAKLISLIVSNQLQQKGFNIEMDFTFTKIQKQIQRASRKMAKACIIIGQNEVANNFISIKWLKSGKQSTIDLNSLDKIKVIYLNELSIYYKS